jgi:hypothetical protein
MRLWTLHPKYLDAKGLVALWREALLAKHVLEGKTKGYTKHPQLERFKKADKPVDCINQYLAVVYNESVERGYNFDKGKIDQKFHKTKLTVTKGQLDFEIDHLLKKLKTRDPEKFRELCCKKKFEQHPLFEVVDGGVEDWEKIK